MDLLNIIEKLLKFTLISFVFFLVILIAFIFVMDGILPFEIFGFLFLIYLILLYKDYQRRTRKPKGKSKGKKQIQTKPENKQKLDFTYLKTDIKPFPRWFDRYRKPNPYGKNYKPWFKKK